MKFQKHLCIAGLSVLTVLATTACAQEQPTKAAPDAKMQPVDVSQDDLAAALQTATDFMVSSLGVKPTRPPVVKSHAEGWSGPVIEITFDDAYRFVINTKDHGLRLFTHAPNWKEPAALDKALTEAEANRLMKSVAAKIGLPEGATQVATYLQPAAGPARQLYYVTYGFNDHDRPVPASFIRLSMNLLNGQLIDVQVDRRKYVIESPEPKLTEAQAKEAAVRYLREKKASHWLDGVRPPTIETMLAGLTLWEVAAPSSRHKNESVPARFRLMWACRYGQYIVGFEAETGAVLHRAGPKSPLSSMP
jgi:hypothetical protein